MTEESLVVRVCKDREREVAILLERERAYLTQLLPEIDPTYFEVTPLESGPGTLKRLEELCRGHDGFLGAYLRGPLQPASAPMPFRSKQGHLDSPPGLGLSDVWNVFGGDGKNVRVLVYDLAIDEEQVSKLGVTFNGYNGRRNANLRNHGAAVVGLVGARQHQVGTVACGVSGCAPNSSVIFHGAKARPNCRELLHACRELVEGDILLLPVTTSVSARGKTEIPLEWCPDFQLVIDDLTARGIIVVQAAGNSDTNLDDPWFDKPPMPPHKEWVNPFSRASSGRRSIFVGASHVDINLGTLPVSNYGRCVRVQGWGESVVTWGYGDLQIANNPSGRFTARFGGTSAAAAMIAGALACLQGILRAESNVKLMTQATALDALMMKKQIAPPTSRPIGHRPDLSSFDLHSLLRAHSHVEGR